jgi:predicted AAA+ superfamily ATPase
MIEQLDVEEPSPPLHRQLLKLFRDYMLIGGLPAVVAKWIDRGSLVDCAQAQHSLLSTYRDDFAKYSGRVAPTRLVRVLDAVPRQLGQKFTYSKVDREERSYALRQALDLLCKARLCHRIHSCDASGIPLAAGIKEQRFKVMLLDVGLVSASLGLATHALRSTEEAWLVNEGALAEQAIGQALRTLEPRYIEPALFYWARDRKGSSAELDYLIQHGTRVVPVEVKAGTTGTLKSLHLFMAQRKLPVAVRFSAQTPSLTEVDMLTTSGQSARYRLLTLPLYLAGQTHRLLSLAALKLWKLTTSKNLRWMVGPL